MKTEIKLPELGEGIDSGTVVALVAQAGESLNENDPVIEIETDKAMVPVPAGVSGILISLAVKEGKEIKPGEIIGHIETEKTSPSSEKHERKDHKVAPASSPSGEKAIKIISFKLPELGEGIDGGTVASVIARENEVIRAEEAVMELETDKAVIPIPAPETGILKEVRVKANDEVKVGDVLFVLEASASLIAPPETKTDAVAISLPPPEIKKPSPPPEKTDPPPASAEDRSLPAPAGPAARKLARELGVAIEAIRGSARGGRITPEDVKVHVKEIVQKGSSQVRTPLPPLPDFSRYGSVRREKIAQLRKTISNRMAAHWSHIPHVHQFQEVDISEITSLQKQYTSEFKEEGSTLSVTQFVLKSMALGLREFPIFNASFDENRDEIIYKEYCHIGVAVDTPSGLIVPVLRDVDQKSIFTLGKELKELAKRTRERKVGVEELKGASITLSNLGGIGGTHFTPIINHPEVAIVGIGRAAVKPVLRDGEFVPRTFLPLCVAYDHRIIDGADGARFVMRLTHYLEKVVYHLMR